jgi:hypothetical protein
MLLCVTEAFDPHTGPPGYVYARISDHLAARIATGELGKGVLPLRLSWPKYF